MKKMLLRFVCSLLGHVPDDGRFNLESGQPITRVYRCLRCDGDLGEMR